MSLSHFVLIQYNNSELRKQAVCFNNKRSASARSFALARVAYLQIEIDLTNYSSKEQCIISWDFLSPYYRNRYLGFCKYATLASQ
jgi:hypothetical protein